MKHNYVLKGGAFSLNPVTLEDAQFIVELRSDSDRAKYLNPTSVDVEKQKKWILDYFERKNDYYFKVTNNFTGKNEGLISVYDIEKEEGEVGRWILFKDSLAATESMLLIYKFAFNHLNLRKTFTRTLTENEKVVSFHDSIGANREGVLVEEFHIQDEKKDAIKHVVDKENVDNIIIKLEKFSEMIAKRMNRER